MAKRKLQQFAELATFPHVIQPPFEELPSFYLKGNWGASFFKNTQPLTIELGCGKGEYTVGLAKKNPENNYIGVDFKGARIWRGAKTALDDQLSNVGFVRTKIDFIDTIFGQQEVSEIWITFPDPQLRKERKRLTAPNFLDKYKQIITPEGLIHLKTDSLELYEYTLSVIKEYNYPLHDFSSDVYKEGLLHPVTAIQTHYEKIFSDKGFSIKYICFSIV